MCRYCSPVSRQVEDLRYATKSKLSYRLWTVQEADGSFTTTISTNVPKSRSRDFFMHSANHESPELSAELASIKLLYDKEFQQAAFLKHYL